MAVIGRSSRDCRWFFVFFLVLTTVGPPTAGKTESSASAARRPPSVQECRVHIEKALRDYWERLELTEEDDQAALPEDDDAKDEETEDRHVTDEDDDDDDDDQDDKENENPSIKRQDDDDDKDDDDDEETVRSKRDLAEEHPGDDKDDDDDDEHDKGEDDSEEEDKEVKPHSAAGGVEKQLPSGEFAPEQPKDLADEEEEKDVGVEEDGDDDEDEETEEVEDEEEGDEMAHTRDHIREMLHLDDIGAEEDLEDEKLIQKTLHEIKKIYNNDIKPLETIYKFKDISTRMLGDAEIYVKPMVLLLGPWSSGKSSIINYLLGIEHTPQALKTRAEPTDTDFTVITYGEVPQKISGTELAADWAFSSVQKFGQGFLDHFRGIHIHNKLLQKITFVDTPGIIDNRKHQDRGYPFNDAFQWFIDRADFILVVFDPAKIEIGSELQAVLDQIKGREGQVRFLLNKADSVPQGDGMRVVGQLFWHLSPLMGSTEAPVIYAVSMTSRPFQPGSSPAFLISQERAMLRHIRDTMVKRLENRISYARRHAVRVRNHAKTVDCYLSTYYKHKSLFSSKKKVATEIIENPAKFGIYEGLSTLTNVSRYDLPDPKVYKEFFTLHPLYDFKPLSSTCSYFRGCPLDKLDIAIAYDLPELLGKYKKELRKRAAQQTEPMQMEEKTS